MNLLEYCLDPVDSAKSPLGLIVLQTDETIEPEFNHYFSTHKSPIFVTRISSDENVTKASLAAMKGRLEQAADLLPKARSYSVVGYGCTSATSVIGSKAVELAVKRSCDTANVTNPLRAAIAKSHDLEISKLALLSPYIEEVNEPLRTSFAESGLSTDVFGSFGVSEEAKVVRISRDSIVEAAVQLGRDPNVEGVFLSCTNLRTLQAIPEIERRVGKPVLSSNQALAWHMKRLEATVSPQIAT